MHWGPAKSQVLTKWHKVPIRVEHCKKFSSPNDFNLLKVDDEEQWEEMVCSLPSFWHDNCLAATTGANPSHRAGMSDCPGGKLVRRISGIKNPSDIDLGSIWRFQLTWLSYSLGSHWGALFQFYWDSHIKSGQQTIEIWTTRKVESFTILTISIAIPKKI